MPDHTGNIQPQLDLEEHDHTNRAKRVNVVAGTITATPVGTQDVNLIQVGGASIALGQAVMASSVPVVLASNQSSIPVAATLAAETTKVIGTVNQGTSPWIVAGGGTAGTAASGVVTVQGITSMTPVQVSQATASNLNMTEASGAAIKTAVELIDDTIVAQGTALGSTKVSLMGGSVTLGAPTYTIGQINALSLSTFGSLRTDIATVNSAAVNTGTGSALSGTIRVALADDANVVNTELPAAAALADNETATPVIPRVGAVMMGMDNLGGNDIDRARLATLFDLDTAGGTTQYVAGVSLRTGGSGGSIEHGVSASPLYAIARGDPTVGNAPVIIGGVDDPTAPATLTTWSVNTNGAGLVRGSGTFTVSAAGNVAHDAVDSGNPVKVGGKALTARQTAVANNDRTNAWFDEFGRQIVGLDWFTRSDTFTVTGNGTTVDCSRNPVKNFSILVKMTGAVTSWDVRLEGSNDNTNFTTILTHTNVAPGDGLMIFSGATMSPVLYFRARAAGLVLGAGTNVVVTSLGMN